MSRIARAVALGFPHHVVQRGNNTEKVFLHDEDKEKYLWAVARYIEQNPMRARIVKKAEDYPYSSAKAHIDGVKDEILGEALFEGRQREDYIELMKASIKEEEINNIRNHTRNGRPVGSESFIEKMERKLDRIFKSKPRGRPKKEKR